jgi:hypothetical protein
MSDELTRRPLLMRVLDAMQEADNYYVSPDQAQVAIALIRGDTLEQAAKVADENGAGLAANRIRALKGKQDVDG